MSVMPLRPLMTQEALCSLGSDAAVFTVFSGTVH